MMDLEKIRYDLVHGEADRAVQELILEVEELQAEVKRLSEPVESTLDLEAIESWLNDDEPWTARKVMELRVLVLPALIAEVKRLRRG